MAKRSLLLEQEFRKNAAKLTAKIARLERNLAKKERKAARKTIGVDLTQFDEHGLHYEKNILPYLQELEKIRENNKRDIQKLAQKITDLVTLAKNPIYIKGNDAKNFRRDIWLQFATALTPLSGRPTKKVMALILDEADNLVDWDGNHLAFGVTSSAAHFVKNKHSNRGIHLWCAERNVFAKMFGLQAEVAADADIPTMHASLNKLTSKIGSTLTGNKELLKYTIVSSHHPCMVCAEVIAPKNPQGKGFMRTVKEVIAHWDHKHEIAMSGNGSRRTKNSRQRLKQAGIKVVTTSMAHG